MRRIAKIVNFRVRGRSYLKLGRLNKHIGRQVVVVYKFGDTVLKKGRLIEVDDNGFNLATASGFASMPFFAFFGDGTAVIITKNKQFKKSRILYKNSQILKKNEW